MTTQTKSNTPTPPPFWDKETTISITVAAIAMGLYAVPILLWVVNTI